MPDPTALSVRPLASLSPSRAQDFQSCPLLYRFRVLDRLPEPPSPAAVRGTLVHAVLEALYDLPAGERTLDRAIELLAPQWSELVAERPEVVEMLAGSGEDESDWLRGAGDLLGVQQSGMPEFRVADLETQAELHRVAQDDARLLLAADPDLTGQRGRATRVLLYLLERERAIGMLTVG